MEKISVCDAAKKMDVTTSFLRAAIVQQKIPGAVAIDRGKRFSFWINKEIFEEWITNPSLPQKKSA